MVYICLEFVIYWRANMNVNYELYKIFFVVANSKTITEAAKKLFISQPAVTQSINNLEKQLNTTLFIRNTKGTKLTKTGKELYKQIKPAIEQILSAEKNLSLKQSKQKKLIIGINDAFLQQYIIKALKKLTLKYSNVLVGIHEHSTNLLLNEMMEEKIDFIITTLNKDNIDKNNFEITKLTQLHFCIIKNIFSNTTFSYNDLKNNKIICNDIEIINNLKIENKNTIIVDNYYQIYELVLQNVGVGVIPIEFVNNYLNDKKVEIIREDVAITDIYLILNKENINIYATKFKNLIVENFNINKQSQI